MSTGAIEGIRDPGGVRPIAARWAIEADLVLESATHLGGGAGDSADMVILRDVRTGGPLLPGTSIAGALRSHLADVLGGYQSAEDSRVSRLFGSPRENDLGGQSPLIVFDSVGNPPQGSGVEIRDGVQIDIARGTAEDRKKFDLEVLPAGTRFPLRFDQLVPAVEDEAELLSLLVTALDGLSRGDVALGARRSRGLGMARANAWWAVRHDLTSRAGWIRWVLSRHVHPTGRAGSGTSDAAEACKAAAPTLTLQRYEDQRRRVVVEADLSLKGALLVRSAPATPDAPDAVHLQSGGRSVLPGTGLAGVLRTQALRIASVVRDRYGDSGLWVEELFGPRMVGVTRAASSPLYASRLRIAEAAIENGTRTRGTRVRIDRFTHGVVPGALFEEEIEQLGRVRVRMELREPRPGELGLLVLLLKDLLGGDAAVGGSSAVGRGVFTGKATLRMEDGRELTLDPARPADPSIERAIREFWDMPAQGGVR